MKDAFDELMGDIADELATLALTANKAKRRYALRMLEVEKAP